MNNLPTTTIPQLPTDFPLSELYDVLEKVNIMIPNGKGHSVVLNPRAQEIQFMITSINVILIDNNYVCLANFTYDEEKVLLEIPNSGFWCSFKRVVDVLLCQETAERTLKKLADMGYEGFHPAYFNRGANNNRKLRRPASVPLAASQVPPPRGPQQLPMAPNLPPQGPRGGPRGGPPNDDDDDKQKEGDINPDLVFKTRKQKKTNNKNTEEDKGHQYKKEQQQRHQQQRHIKKTEPKQQPWGMQTKKSPWGQQQTTTKSEKPVKPWGLQMDESVKPWSGKKSTSTPWGQTATASSKSTWGTTLRKSDEEYTTTKNINKTKTQMKDIYYEGTSSDDYDDYFSEENDINNGEESENWQREEKIDFRNSISNPPNNITKKKKKKKEDKTPVILESYEPIIKPSVTTATTLSSHGDNERKENLKDSLQDSNVNLIQNDADIAKSGNNDDLIPEEGKVRLGTDIYDGAKAIKKMLAHMSEKYDEIFKRDRTKEVIPLEPNDKQVIIDCLKFDPSVDNTKIRNIMYGRFPSFQYVQIKSRQGKARKEIWKRQDREESFKYLQFPLKFGNYKSKVWEFINVDDFKNYIYNERRMENWHYRKGKDDDKFLQHWFVTWQQLKRTALKIQRWFRNCKKYDFWGKEFTVSLQGDANKKRIHFIRKVTIYKIPQILYEEYDAAGNNYELKQFKKSNAVPNMDLLNPGIPGVQHNMPKREYDTISPSMVVHQRHKRITTSIIDEFVRRDVNYRKFINHVKNRSGIYLNEADQTDLIKRGVKDIDLDTFQKEVLLFTIKSNHVGIDPNLAVTLPGLTKRKKLNEFHSEPGLFIPAKTPDNKIIGAQIKIYKNSGWREHTSKKSEIDKKYVWWGNSLSNSEQCESYNIIMRDCKGVGRVEDPLFCWRNFDQPASDVKTIALCEGALKPALAYYFAKGRDFRFFDNPSNNDDDDDDKNDDMERNDILGNTTYKPIDAWVGVVGGAFEHNRVMLKSYLNHFPNLQNVVIVPDANAVMLDVKMSQGGVLINLVKEILKTRNVLCQDMEMTEDSILVATWPEQKSQDENVEALDIDDLLMVPRNINKISIIPWKQFIEDVHNLADKNVSKEAIAEYVKETYASRPRGQNHGSTIIVPGDDLIALPESSRLKKNTTNSSDAMLTNNIGKKEDKNDRKSLDQMKVSKTTSSILPSNVVSVKPSLSKVSNIANKIDLGNKCFYTIDGINQYRFSLCKKYEVEYNTAFGPPEQQHNTMKDQMYVDIKEQNFWIDCLRYHDDSVEKLENLKKVIYGYGNKKGDGATLEHFSSVLLLKEDERGNISKITFSVKKIMKKLGKILNKNLNLQPAKVKKKSQPDNNVKCTPSKAPSPKAIEKSSDYAKYTSDTPTQMAEKKTTKTPGIKMYRYLVEVSKTYRGEKIPFQQQNWHYITSKPALLIKNPCTWDTTVSQLTDRGTYEEKRGQYDIEENQRYDRKLVHKVEILNDGKPYEIPWDDDNIRKQIVHADLLFSKNSKDFSKSATESNWVYYMPDLYNDGNDNESFLCSLNKLLSSDIHKVFDGLNEETGKFKINSKVYSSILFYNPTCNLIGICNPRDKSEYKSLRSQCYRKGKNSISYKTHYSKKGYKLIHEKQMFLPLRGFPKTNEKIDMIPAELLYFHSKLTTNHFKTLDLLKKWHKDVLLGGEFLRVEGRWKKKLTASLSSSGFDFKLKDERLNKEVNIHKSFRASRYPAMDDNGKDFLNYERLETLGDAILGYCLASLLTYTFKSNTAYVCFVLQALSRNKILAAINRKFNMYSFLQHVDLPKDINSPGLKDKILADHVEAWIGGKYLDTDISETRACIAHMFSICTAEDLFECLEDMETVENTISFSTEMRNYIVDVVHSWSNPRSRFDSIALQKKFDMKHQQWLSELLTTSKLKPRNKAMQIDEHDNTIFKQHIKRLSKYLPEQINVNTAYLAICDNLISRKLSHVLNMWGNQLLKLVAVEFAFNKKYEYIDYPDKYYKKLNPGDIHGFKKLFSFTKYQDSCARYVFEGRLLRNIQKITDGIKDTANDLQNEDQVNERHRQADSLLRKKFYVFGAFLDVFDSKNVSGKCSKLFFKDIVIERILNDYEYLRTDFSPSNQRKVYNDVMKKSYPGNKRVIDLEVDRLNNLNLADIFSHTNNDDGNNSDIVGIKREEKLA